MYNFLDYDWRFQDELKRNKWYRNHIYTQIEFDALKLLEDSFIDLDREKSVICLQPVLDLLKLSIYKLPNNEKLYKDKLGAYVKDTHSLYINEDVLDTNLMNFTIARLIACDYYDMDNTILYKTKIEDDKIYKFAMYLLIPTSNLFKYVTLTRNVRNLSGIFAVPESVVIRRLNQEKWS